LVCKFWSSIGLSQYLCEIPSVFGLRAETASSPEANPGRDQPFRPIRPLFFRRSDPIPPPQTIPAAPIAAGRFSGEKPYQMLHDPFRTPAGTGSHSGSELNTSTSNRLRFFPRRNTTLGAQTARHQTEQTTDWEEVAETQIESPASGPNRGTSSRRLVLARPAAAGRGDPAELRRRPAGRAASP